MINNEVDTLKAFSSKLKKLNSDDINGKQHF